MSGINTPYGTPPWMQSIVQNIETWVRSLMFGPPVKFPTYTVSDLPLASAWAGCQINVSNETGGYVPAFSDGTNWRRYTDRAIVS